MFKLKLRDYLKGLLVAILSPVVAAVLESLNAGVVVINWTHIWQVALAAGLVYLGKNFLTDDFKVAAKIVAKETNDEEPVILSVDELPITGARGVWYYYNGNYYYWNGTTNSFVNAGGDRPTKPPHNP